MINREHFNKNSRAVSLMGDKALELEAVGLPWVGGKKRMYKDYAKYFPDEIDTLIDLFAGGGTISFSTPANKTISNDFDMNIINLYEVLSGDDWKSILDYERSKENFDIAHSQLRNPCIYLSTLDRAKYMVADVFMSFNKGRGSFRNNGPAHYRKSVEKVLQKISDAIHEKNIQFVCGDALDLLKEKLDDPTAFWFVDPPYINNTINNHVYYKSMLSDRVQEDLAWLLTKCTGKVMMCGYRDGNNSCPLYDLQFLKSGFHCYKLLETVAFSEHVEKGNKKSKRVEYIWVNYEIPDLEEVQMCGQIAA